MEVSQKVFVLPQFLLKDGTENKLTVIKLKHPRTGQLALFALDSVEKKIFEIVHFSEEHSSWFIQDTVEKDGSLFMMTPADPLFFILPYICQESRYCQLEDILVDENNLDVKQLLVCCSKKDIENIADLKDAMGTSVYRYNKKKTLSWLKKKVLLVSKCIAEKNISTSDGSKVSSFIQRKGASLYCSEETCNRYACQLVSEYLPDEISKELFDTLGLQVEQNEKKGPEKGTNAQPQKKMKGEAVEPEDDYTKQINTDVLQSKQKTKLTTAQKQLLKTDKTGMKNISSFFKKK